MAEEFTYEEVTIEDSDDDMPYEEVPEDDDEDEDDDELQDFQSVLHSLKLQPKDAHPNTKPSTGNTKLEVSVQKRPTVVDDFFRNFLIKMEMKRTLDTFQNEWYELSVSGKTQGLSEAAVPDIYLKNDALDNDNKNLRLELTRMKTIAEKAKSTWDKLRKERDFHRMHHRRVVQEKNKLILDMKRLKKHYSAYEPTLKAMQQKYEQAMKEKTLMRLERDKFAAKVDSLTQQVNALENLSGGAPATNTKHTSSSSSAAAAAAAAASSAAEDKKAKSKRKEAEWPAEERVNPHSNANYEPANVSSFSLQKTFKGHSMPIAGMALHPRKPILATVSDDMTWKMWSIPNGDLIMSGDGHKDWVSCCDFSPKGNALATGSGDCTVKIWDFLNACCAVTFTDHTQAVWGVSYHDSGEFLVSCSMDHTAKLWDLTAQKCRQTYRGHVDSVNSTAFQPYSNNLCTGSGDKTVSLWDMRTGLCVQTFYGHRNAVNHVTFNLKGDTIASADADGVIKVWDVRMVSEKSQIVTGNQRHPVNEVRFDRSGQVAVAACDDGSIKLFNVFSGEQIGELHGHSDSVQSVLFDHQSKSILSAGSDNSFRVWA